MLETHAQSPQAGLRSAGLVRAAAWAGLLGVAAVIVGSLVAGIVYTGTGGEAYSPLNHWISELGEIGVSSLAVVFNLSLVIGGASFVAFHAGLFAATTGQARFAILVVGVASGVAGALVGILPMNNHGAHQAVALTFFLTGWIGPAILAVRLLRGPRDGLPRWLAVPGLVAAVASTWFLAVLFDPATSASGLHAPATRGTVWLVATPEWATLVAILAWTACVAVVLLRRERALPGPA